MFKLTAALGILTLGLARPKTPVNLYLPSRAIEREERGGNASPSDQYGPNIRAQSGGFKNGDFSRGDPLASSYGTPTTNGGLDARPVGRNGISKFGPVDSKGSYGDGRPIDSYGVPAAGDTYDLRRSSPGSYKSPVPGDDGYRSTNIGNNDGSNGAFGVGKPSDSYGPASGDNGGSTGDPGAGQPAGNYGPPAAPGSSKVGGRGPSGGSVGERPSDSYKPSTSGANHQSSQEGFGRARPSNNYGPPPPGNSGKISGESNVGIGVFGSSRTEENFGQPPPPPLNYTISRYNERTPSDKYGLPPMGGNGNGIDDSVGKPPDNSGANSGRDRGTNDGFGKNTYLPPVDIFPSVSFGRVSGRSGGNTENNFRVASESNDEFSGGRSADNYLPPSGNVRVLGSSRSVSGNNHPSNNYDAPKAGGNGRGGFENDPIVGHSDGRPSGDQMRDDSGNGGFGGASSSDNYDSANRGANGNQGYYSNRRGDSNGSGRRNGFGSNDGGSAVEERNDEPAKYEFSYEVEDKQSGSNYGHTELRDGDRTQGEFNVVLPDGRTQIVEYEADEDGFKPQIRYEGEANTHANGLGGSNAAGGYPPGNEFDDSNGNGYPSGGSFGIGNSVRNGHPPGGPLGSRMNAKSGRDDEYPSGEPSRDGIGGDNSGGYPSARSSTDDSGRNGNGFGGYPFRGSSKDNSSGLGSAPRREVSANFEGSPGRLNGYPLSGPGANNRDIIGAGDDRDNGSNNQGYPPNRLSSSPGNNGYSSWNGGDSGAYNGYIY